MALLKNLLPPLVAAALDDELAFRGSAFALAFGSAAKFADPAPELEAAALVDRYAFACSWSTSFETAAPRDCRHSLRSIESKTPSAC